MIQLLGKIQIPESLIDYLKTAKPTRSVSQINSKSFSQQLSHLGPEVNVENYKFYTDANTGILEYQAEWFKDIIPEEFLQLHNLSRPINAVVLKVQPGHFTAPHKDQFNGTVYAYQPDVDFDSIVRMWIPVEDCKFGQALFVESEVLYNYRAGEVYTFGNYDFHSAANAGLDHRYSLLIYSKQLPAQVAEWPNARDCKSLKP
jgi:hypothetical protein